MVFSIAQTVQPLLFLAPKKNGMFLIEAFIAAVCGSLMDLDHFIASSSTSIHDATHLSHRPFAHTVIFPFLLGALLARLFKSSRLGVICVSSMFAHQMRDSIRRGLWFWPIASTPPIPYPVYLITLILLPPLVAFIADLRLLDAVAGIPASSSTSNLAAGNAGAFS